MKIFANSIPINPRESAYFSAVMLLLLPLRQSAIKDIAGWTTSFVVFLMLFAATIVTLRDKTMFLWDKILFVTISVFSIVAVGITTFFGPIDVIRTMALILGCIACLFTSATGIAYMIMKKKNWSLPVPFEEVVRFWLSNNLACLSLILAVSHSL